jgi:hypothetical protein
MTGDAGEVRQPVGKRDIDKYRTELLTIFGNFPNAVCRSCVGSEEQGALFVFHQQSVCQYSMGNGNRCDLQSFSHEMLAGFDRMKRDQIRVAILQRFECDPDALIEEMLLHCIQVRRGRIEFYGGAYFVEKVCNEEGEREDMVEMSMGNYYRSQAKLLFNAQSNSDRAGVDSQRLIDQIGGQQLVPAISCAWDDFESHSFNLSRNCATAAFAGLISSSLFTASRAAALSPLSIKAAVRFWSVFSWRGS